MKARVLFVLLLVSVGFADQADYLFQQGVQAYQNGDYEKAIESFEAVLQHGRESAALYYNLGNAYYKTGNIARSIINYERATKIDPNDEDIAFNLKVARLRVVDKIPTPELDYVFKIWQSIKNALGLNSLTVLTLVLYGLLIGLLVVKVLVRKPNVQNALRYGITPVLILFLLGAFLFGIRVREDLTARYGVILAPKVAVTSSPAQDATEVFALHEGVKVRVVAQSGDYYRIRLSDGKDGWVEVGAMEII